jgi:hypothetical protein
MSTCHCDGPPHTYSPGWCRAGRDGNGKPINKNLAAAQLELQAAQLRAEAEAER